jgi:hypothetical protein
MAPASAAAPSPPAAPSDASPEPEPAANADEDDESVRVTEALARLADLRDQGAISPEEYEQKKDELLGRP